MGKKVIKDSSALGQFGSAIAQICTEKGLDKDRVIESVEAALAAAYKKDYGEKGQIIIAHMDENTGEVEFKQIKEVVDLETRTLDEEYIPEKIHDIPENASKSNEVIERVKPQEVGDGEETVPKFNLERDILVEDAKKIDDSLEVGDLIEIPLESKDQYGRVASQTAKQVIIQRIREAERDSMYREYKEKEGEVISGTVQRIENDKVYIDLGKAVGALIPSEQIPSEHYGIGQRLRVYVESVESDSKGPGVILSRRHGKLLEKLFELEVPEIFSGTVEIKAVAREAGSRSKIAVSSNEEGIDPIGSCVGQKGTRVQAIIDELGGEKVDIIEWSDDIEELIASALSPAKIIKVEVNEESKVAVAFVTQDQLSLAIGKRGQNVRLAANLVNWKIDVEVIDGGSEVKEDKEGKNKDSKSNDLTKEVAESEAENEEVEQDDNDRKEEKETKKKIKEEEDVTKKEKKEGEKESVVSKENEGKNDNKDKEGKEDKEGDSE